MVAMISEKQTIYLNLYKLKCSVRFWMVLHLAFFFGKIISLGLGAAAKLWIGHL